MSRSSRRNARTRAVTGLINAQAAFEGEQARRAEIALDDKRFDDAVAQRDRYIPMFAQAAAAHEIRVFEYAQILANGSRDTHLHPKGPHR